MHRLTIIVGGPMLMPVVLLIVAGTVGVLAGLLRRRVPLPSLAVASGAAASAARVPVPDYLPGDSQDTCDPTPKPGIMAFRAFVLDRYGGQSGGAPKFGISRACEVGGTSEHKEGRAWDWFPPDRQTGDRLVRDLLADNVRGVHHAAARRWGLQYFIWFRRIWLAHKAATDAPGELAGWKAYGRTGSATIEHRDHIHFTMGREAAAQAHPLRGV